ncbi:hypothetical protein ACFYL6_20880 [Micromonospora sp. NPDC007208]|uniref:hypothetical protein n=1 Tax=Micromonospora sp. NPDC007208 TaxID=3364236 RepID=UPI0036C1B79A
MARVKQPYDERRMVAWLGREVDPGEIVEVPDGDLASYLEAGWQPGQDKETKALVDALRKEQEPTGDQQQSIKGKVAAVKSKNVVVTTTPTDQQQGQGEQPGTGEES